MKKLGWAVFRLCCNPNPNHNPNSNLNLCIASKCPEMTKISYACLDLCSILEVL